jgi:hypothetical protein
MDDLNKSLGEERMNTVLFMVISILCPPLFWFILYKVDQGLGELSQREGIQYKENFVLWLLLTFVFGIGSLIAIWQITNAFNAVWAKRSSGNVVN